jgi:endonuclease/exonuclease/phosphatase family metal-dependent hydrolase
LKVGSYNVQRPSINPGPDEPRIKGIANLIKGQNLNIVGIQEASEGNLGNLKKYLPNHFKSTSGSGVDDVVFYDSRVFQQTNFGKFSIPKIGANNGQFGRTRNAVWVKLKFKDAKDSVYVINMHADTHPQGRDPAAEAALNQMNKLKKADPGAKVIILGDMNSNYSQANRSQIYKKFNASNQLKITSQATNNRQGYNCDTQNGFDGRQDCSKRVGSHLDQIWVSKNAGIEVKRWANIANQETIRLSDHNPVITDLQLTVTK